MICPPAGMRDTVNIAIESGIRIEGSVTRAWRPVIKFRILDKPRGVGGGPVGCGRRS